MTTLTFVVSGSGELESSHNTGPGIAVTGGGNFDMSGTATNPRGAGQPRSKRVSPDDEAALSVGRLVLLSSALVDLISSAI